MGAQTKQVAVLYLLSAHIHEHCHPGLGMLEDCRAHPVSSASMHWGPSETCLWESTGLVSRN